MEQLNITTSIFISKYEELSDSERHLVDEAQQALNKAFDEEGLPIVAFRVNPEKYRQYLSDNE